MNDVFRTAIIIPKNTFENCFFFRFHLYFFLTFIVIDSSKATFEKTFPIYFFLLQTMREAGNSASGTKYSIAYRIKTCIRRPKDGVNKSSSFF